jgi:hypothetical protein
MREISIGFGMFQRERNTDVTDTISQQAIAGREKKKLKTIRGSK